MKTLPPLAAEFEGADLPDLRLMDRVLKIASQLEADPELSFPEAFRDPSQLEATYRFFGNERLDLASILAGHIEATLGRIGRDECLAIHDTTGFSFEGEREGLGFVDRTQRGFHAHVCLAVSSEREPLGLLAVDPWVRRKKKGKRSTEKRKAEGNLESERWLKQSLAVEELFSRTGQCIHVEDREGDIFESLAARTDAKMRFIVRAAGTRVALVGRSTKNVLELARELPSVVERQVQLSARKAHMGHMPRSQYKDRQEREALLVVRAGPMRVCRPRRGGRVDDLPLNAVHVLEKGTPEGEEAVEWLLFTTEPIDTIEAVERVVDAYRARWLIEEYFKALKTGCKYEERQLETADALLRALGIFAIVAWRLLVLRHSERNATDAPATTIATKAELDVMTAKKLLPKKPTAAQFLKAVARYGGHLPQNGRPGLLVLWRGLRAIQALASGWALARKM